MQCMLRVLLIVMGFICFIIFLHIHRFHSHVSSFSHCSLFSSLAIIFSVLIMFIMFHHLSSSFIMFHNCSSFFTAFASESSSRVRCPSPPPKKSAPPHPPLHLPQKKRCKTQVHSIVANTETQPGSELCLARFGPALHRAPSLGGEVLWEAPS